MGLVFGILRDVSLVEGYMGLVFIVFDMVVYLGNV